MSVLEVNVTGKLDVVLVVVVARLDASVGSIQINPPMARPVTVSFNTALPGN